MGLRVNARFKIVTKSDLILRTGTGIGHLWCACQVRGESRLVKWAELLCGRYVRLLFVDSVDLCNARDGGAGTRGSG